MSFDWSEYLDLAQELVGQIAGPASQEARSRTALSRAYYAAFKKAYNYLRGLDSSIVFVRQDIHTYVIEKFLYSPDNLCKEIGANLDRLRRERNRADYEDTIPQLDSITMKALKQAAKVITNLARL
jgi:hypothetical protein